MATIIAVFVAINMVIKSLELTPIDFSQDHLFTLTQESIDKIKDIGKSISIYFMEYEDNDSTVDLAKQYAKANQNIKVEAVKVNDRPDLAQKYEITSGMMGIIVECGDRYKVLNSSELVTYDSSSYQSVSVAEEKLTAAIQSVASDDIPKVYFLSGYSNFSLENNLQCLNVYLQNEITDVASVDILKTGKVPDDCDTLVIMSPSKDFDEDVTNYIVDYINSGRNILWFQSATGQELDTPNANRILEIYGIDPFDVGVVRETDSDKMVANMPDFILPDIQSSDVTEKIQNLEGVILLDATKINIKDDETLKNKKIEKTELLKTSENAYYRTNFYYTSDEPQEGEEKASFTVGQMMTKTLEDANTELGKPAKKSTLIIYSEAFFVSDTPISQSTMEPAVMYRKNKDLALNSIAYLSNREEDITVRKSTGAVTYTATETENNVILVIVFAVPILIILLGVIVWIMRRRKK